MASICFSGKELSKLLGVSPAALSKARSLGHLCGGYPVADWAAFKDGGALMGYLVPSKEAFRLLAATPSAQKLINDLLGSNDEQQAPFPASMPALTAAPAPRSAIASHQAAGQVLLERLVSKHPGETLFLATGLLLYSGYRALREG